jgi:hypothetical protein
MILWFERGEITKTFSIVGAPLDPDEEGICSNCRSSIFFNEDILPNIEDFVC